MITVVNYLHKGRWYGCADDASNAFGYYGFGGSSIDNSQPSDDLLYWRCSLLKDPKWEKVAVMAFFAVVVFIPTAVKERRKHETDQQD